MTPAVLNRLMVSPDPSCTRVVSFLVCVAVKWFDACFVETINSILNSTSSHCLIGVAEDLCHLIFTELPHWMVSNPEPDAGNDKLNKNE